MESLSETKYNLERPAGCGDNEFCGYVGQLNNRGVQLVGTVIARVRGLMTLSLLHVLKPTNDSQTFVRFNFLTFV